MIYPIVKFGNPVLEKPAEPVTVFDDQLKKLVEDMFVGSPGTELEFAL